jgi:hypothetical protein
MFEIRFMNSALAWWKPETLLDARGGRCESPAARGRRVCRLVAGRERDSAMVRCYYEIEEWPEALATGAL